MASDDVADPASGASGLAVAWWKDFQETVPEGYLDLIAAEDDAARIVHFHPTFVPGLLQTREYAAALTPATTLKQLSAHDAARLVEVRMLRQQAALDGDRPKRLTFLMDEAAMHRPVGDPGIMRAQLLQLDAMAGHPGVTLRILPFRGQPHPGLLGPFMVLQYDGGLDDVLCFEGQLGNVLVHNDPVLAGRYCDLADRLAADDPDGQATRRLIHAAIGRFTAAA